MSAPPAAAPRRHRDRRASSAGLSSAPRFGAGWPRPGAGGWRRASGARRRGAPPLGRPTGLRRRAARAAGRAPATRVQQVRSEIIVIFGADDGLTGHADHRAVASRTVEAAALAGHRGAGSRRLPSSSTDGGPRPTTTSTAGWTGTRCPACCCTRLALPRLPASSFGAKAPACGAGQPDRRADRPRGRGDLHAQRWSTSGFGSRARPRPAPRSTRRPRSRPPGAGHDHVPGDPHDVHLRPPNPRPPVEQAVVVPDSGATSLGRICCRGRWRLAAEAAPRQCNRPGGPTLGPRACAGRAHVGSARVRALPA